MVDLSIIGAIVVGALSAASYYQQRKMQRQAEKQANEMATHQISGHDSNRALYTVYGRALIGTTTIYKRVSRRNIPMANANFTNFVGGGGSPSTESKTYGLNRFLYRISALCNGPINGIENVLIDGEKYTANRFTAGHTKHFESAVSLGPTAGNHFANLRTSYATDFSAWGADKKGQGVAYVVERFWFDKSNPAYQGEPSTQYLVKGRSLYDPRLDSTVTGGSGSHRSDTPSTWAFSDNPALALLDMLTNNEYGRGVSHADCDLASFITAANKCDTLVDIPARATNTTGSTMVVYDPHTGTTHEIPDNGTISNYRIDQITTGPNANKQKRFRLNMAVDNSKEVLDNIQQILQSFRGNLHHINGDYVVHMDDVASPVLTLTDDDIIGGLKIAQGDRKQRINRMTVKFLNANKHYKTDQVSWPPIDSDSSSQYQTYLAADSGEKLHKTVTLTGCTDYYQAEDIAEYLVRESRVTLALSGTFGSRCFNLVPGDVIALDYDSAGYSGKYFIVDQVGVDVASMNVKLSLREYDSSIYTWNTARGNEPVALYFDEEQQYNASPTSLTLGTVSSAVITLSDGSAQVSLVVPFSDVPEEATSIEVGWAIANSDEYNTQIIQDETADKAKFQLGIDNQNIDIRVRYLVTNADGLTLPSSYTTTTFTLPAVSGTRLDGMEDNATNNEGELADLDKDDVLHEVPSEGLTYYWPCNSITDVSGSGNEELQEVVSGKTGTHSGSSAPTLSTDSPTGKSVVNGNGGFTLLSDTDADALEGANGFAWSIWFKSDTNAGNGSARIIGRDLSDGWGLAINQTQTGNQNITLYGEPSTESMGAVAQGEWHHFCLSEDGNGTISGYVNGELVGTESYTPVNSPRPVVIGCNTEATIAPGASVFEGKLTEIRAYNRALTPQEVRGLYKVPAASAPAEVDGDMIVDGSLFAAKLNVDQLSAISADLGTVTAGQLSISAGTAPSITTNTPSGKGTLLKSDGDVFFGDATSSVEANHKYVFFDQSAGTLSVKGVLAPTDLDLVGINTTTILPPAIKAQSYVDASIGVSALSKAVFDELASRVGTKSSGFVATASGNYLGAATKFIELASTPTHGTQDVTMTVVVSDTFTYPRNFVVGSDQLKISIKLQYRQAGSTGSYTTAGGVEIKTLTPTVLQYATRYTINETVTRTLTSSDITDNQNYDFRVKLERVGSQSAFADFNNGGANDTTGTPILFEVAEGAQSISTGGNADTLDSLDSTQFLRSDVNDTFTGDLSIQGDLTLRDTDNIIFGDDDDMKLFHSGGGGQLRNSTGNLTIRSSATDGDIYFQGDDGSNGTTTYFYLDGGDENLKFNKPVVISSDLTVTGDLTLTGNIDQYNVTDLDVTDRTITVNAGGTQTTSDGAGLIVDRGTATNASLTWNETFDLLKSSHTFESLRFVSRSGDMLRYYVPSWTNATTHTILYNGFNQYLSDYIVLKAAGNNTSGHGALVVADNGIYFGRTDAETGQPIGDATSATDPLDTNWARIIGNGLYLRDNSSLYLSNTTNNGGRINWENASASWDWEQYENDNGELVLTIQGTGGAEFQFDADGSDYTTARFNVGGADVTAGKVGQWNTAYGDKINSAAFSTSTGVLTLTRQDLGTVTVDLDGRYQLGGNNTYRFAPPDQSNLSVYPRYFKVATVNRGNGGAHLKGVLNNHVETFGTQDFDIAIYGRESNSGANIEVTGSFNVGDPDVGVRIVRATTGQTYDDYDVYIVLTRYSQAVVDITKYGATTFDQSGNHTTTQPTGYGVELDTTSATEGSYVIIDSVIHENFTAETKTLTVNSNSTQANSNGAGLVVKRGTAADASILWNESSDEFDVSNTISAPAIDVAFGSVSNPSVAFSANDDVGMYHEWYNQNQNKGQISFSVDGVKRAYFNEAGIFSAHNVYLGNSGSVRAFGAYTNITNGTAGSGFKFTNTADSVDALVIEGDGDATFAGALTANGYSVGTDTVISSTRRFYASDGTVSKASYSFDGESNTGMYKYGANQIGFTVGGTLKAYIQDSTYSLVVSGKISSTGGNSDNWNTAYTRVNDTRIGLNAHSLVNFTAVGDYSKKSGYQTMMRGTNVESTVVGTPKSASYWFYNVIAKRDTNGGTAALLMNYSGNDLYYGVTYTNTAAPTWRRVWDDNNFSQTNVNNWNTAYTYSQVGHLPLAGGTTTGNLTIGTTTDSTKLVFPDKNVADNPTTNTDKRQLIRMGNNGNGGLWQTSGRGGLMLASADDSVIIASGDVGRGYDADAGGQHPNPDTEEIYLLSDGGIRFTTGLQDGFSGSSNYTPRTALITNQGRFQIGTQGSAASPSYSFNGDNNTGMFGNAGDQLGFSAGGTERMRIETGSIKAFVRFDTKTYTSTTYNGFINVFKAGSLYLASHAVSGVAYARFYSAEWANDIYFNTGSSTGEKENFRLRNRGNSQTNNVFQVNDGTAWRDYIHTGNIDDVTFTEFNATKLRVGDTGTVSDVTIGFNDDNTGINGYGNAVTIVANGAARAVFNATGVQANGDLVIATGKLKHGTTDILDSSKNLKNIATATVDKIRIEDTNDVTLGSTVHPFQIGPSSGANVAMDSNELQARNNGAASDLHLNADGGAVFVNNNLAGKVFFSGSATTASATVKGAAGSDAVLKLLEAGTGDVGAHLYYDGGDNKLHIKTGNNPPATRMTFLRDSTNVGIGIQDPTSTLHVNGSIKSSTLTSNGTTELVGTLYLGSGLTRLVWGWNASSGSSLRNYLAPRNDADDAYNYNHEFGYDHNVNSWYIDDQLHLGYRLTHKDDLDTYLEFGANRILLVAGGTTKIDTNNTYLVSETDISTGTITVKAQNLSGGVEGGEIRLQGATGDETINIDNYDSTFRVFDGSAPQVRLSLDTNGNATFAGKVETTNGSATAPSHTFSSDDDNGMYLEWYVQADSKRQVSLSTDGVKRLFVNEAGIFSSNNVYLSNDGSLRSFGTYTNITNGATGGGFKFRNSADGVDSLVITSAGNGTFAGRLVASDGTSVKAAYGFASSSTTGISYSSTNNRVNILSGGAVRAYIQTGSSNPEVETMYVNGIIEANGKVTWSGGSSALANTAYTYSQIGHLPLSGGTITGILKFSDTSSTGRGIYRDNTGYDLRLGGGTDSDSGAYISISGDTRGGSNSTYNGRLEYHTGGNNFSSKSAVLGDHVWMVDWNNSSAVLMTLDSSTGKLTTNGEAEIAGKITADNASFADGDLVISNSGKITYSGSSGSALTIETASPQIRFKDTGSDDDFFIHVNSNKFYVLADRDDSGSWESPHPLELNSNTNLGYVFGSRIATVSDLSDYMKLEGKDNWTRLGYGDSGTAYWHKLCTVTINGSYKDYQISCDWTDRYHRGRLYMHTHSDNDNTIDVWDAYVTFEGNTNRPSINNFRYTKTTSTVEVWIYTPAWREWDYIRTDAVTEGTPIITWYDESTTTQQTSTPANLLAFADRSRVHSGQNTNFVIGNSTNQMTRGGNARISIYDSSVSLSMGVSNNDMMYYRRQGNGIFEMQTYYSGNTGHLRLQPFGGNVSIGSTSSLEKLYVDGNIRSSGNITADNSLIVNGTTRINSAGVATLGTTTTGALTATSISGTSLSISGVFSINSLTSTGTVSGSQFRASYGDASDPAYTFKNDDDTGMWSAGGNVKFSVNGSNRMTIGATATTVSGRISVVGDLQAGSVPQTIITTSRELQNISKFNTNLVPRTFNLPNTGANNPDPFIYLGKASSLSNSGSHIEIRVRTSSGYNANTNQNAYAIIHFKTSNNNSNDNGFYGDLTCYRMGKNFAALSAVHVKQNSNTEYEFYIDVHSFTGSYSNYTVEMSNGTWTNAATVNSTAPSGTVKTVSPEKIFTSENFAHNANLNLGSGTLIANTFNVGTSTVIDANSNLTNIGSATLDGILRVERVDTGAAASTYKVAVFEGTDAHVDITSTSEGTWGSCLLLRESHSSTYRNTWAIARKTGTAPDLVFNFGTASDHNQSGLKYTFASNGNFTATGNVTAYSDERLKDNIETLDGSKVYEMRGVSFTKDGEAGSGVVAQELEAVAPELVQDGEYKSVAYGNLVGYLIEAIKDQKDIIDDLTQRIEELENGNH